MELPVIARREGRRIVVFSLVLENRPGAIARASEVLAEAGVNILAGAHSVSGERGVWTFFAELPEGADGEELSSKLEELECVEEASVGGTVAGEIVINDLTQGYTLMGHETALMRWAWFSKLLEAVKDQWGAAGEAFIYHMGYGAGSSVEPYWREVTGLSGRALTEAALNVMKAMNWMKDFEIVKFDEEEKEVIIRIKGSLECRMAKERGERGPASNYIRGVIAGFVGGILGHPVIAEETACEAEGADYDEIVIRALRL